MNLVPRLRLLPFVALIACGSAPDRAGYGRLTLALEATECAAYCVESITAEIYEDGDVVPIGPAVFGVCGTALRFADIPAGHSIRVRVVLGTGGIARLEGWSDAVVVAANRDTSVTVALEALDPPAVRNVVPDPAPASTTSIVVEGTGLGTGGLAALGPTAVTATTWTPTSITVPLPGTMGSNELTLKTCGLSTAVTALRILAESPDEQAIPSDLCEGATLVALAASDEEAFVALACSTGGRIGRIGRIGRPGCELGLLPVTVGTPTAIAAGPDGPIVALADGTLARITDGGLIAVEWPHATGTVTRLAVGLDGAIAGVGDSGAGLVGGPHGVAFVEETATVRPIDAAPIANGIAVLLDSADGAAVRLVRSQSATLDIQLDGCTAPVGLVSADLELIVACESMVIWVDPMSLGVTPLSVGATGRPAVASGVAFIPGLDRVTVATRAGTVGSFDRTGIAELVAWPDGHLFERGPDGLTALAPYRGTTPCLSP